MSRQKKLKVFQGLVNYGTQAGLFANELRKLGIEALSVSVSDKYKRQIDVELMSGGHYLHKMINQIINWAKRIYWFFHFNTFHFYYGTTLFPKQLDLPFYKLLGKKVLMEYLGYDVQLYQYSLEKYEITNVRFYKPHVISLQADKRKIKRLKYESKHVHKQLVCAPYLSEFVYGAEVLPLAIDLYNFHFYPKEYCKGEIVIMHAPTSKDNKGTSFILNAIDELIKEGYKIKFNLVENVTHDELKKNYIDCDVFIDQIIAGWYGTAAIEAMALGRPTICFIRKSYFVHIEYGDSIPIINAEPSTIYNVLKNTIDNKHLLPEIGKKSREFVEEIHDLKKLTQELISIYKSF